MNERIKALAVEADFMLCEDGHFYSEGQTQRITDQLQKFAELIIRDQQRKWVGLTDEELQNIAKEFWSNTQRLFREHWYEIVAFMKEAEAKLKDKNT